MVDPVTLTCHICEAEAVSRCYSCGQLVCAEHGKTDTCGRCTTAIASGDPRADRFSASPMKSNAKSGWWRPQEAEVYVPPACYVCQGLTRATCRNCDNKYCREHAGPNGLCKQCGQSAQLGLYVFATMAGLVLLFLLYHWWFGP
jgi:hypothetical protein